MFRRILIPTDFSTASEWAFEDAVRLAGTCGGELIILHIRMTRTSRPGELRFPAQDELYDYAEQHELGKLRETVKRMNSNVSTRLVVKQGPDPGNQICLTAAEESADLVVMATHARHHVAHLFIGSTTLNVLTHAPAPLLVIRYGIPKRTTFRRFLVPVHLKQSTHAALGLAASWARDTGGEVHLLTVCSDGERSDAERLATSLRAQLLDGVTAEVVIIRGSDIEREIVRYAEKNDVDAVILNPGTEMGSVKNDVIRKVATPVMIAPV
jgi:nucleotide-binding universal stress UspA family protein